MFAWHQNMSLLFCCRRAAMTNAIVVAVSVNDVWRVSESEERMSQHSVRVIRRQLLSASFALPWCSETISQTPKQTTKRSYGHESGHSAMHVPNQRKLSVGMQSVRVKNVFFREMLSDTTNTLFAADKH